MVELVLAAVVGLVTGAVVALKVVAPKTKTKKDDDVLKFLESNVVPLLEEVAKLKK